MVKRCSSDSELLITNAFAMKIPIFHTYSQIDFIQTKAPVAFCLIALNVTFRAFCNAEMKCKLPVECCIFVKY